MSEMFMPSSSSRPHPRQLELRWTGNDIPTLLSQKMTLSGTEGSKWLLIEYPPPGECMLSRYLMCTIIIHVSFCCFQNVQSGMQVINSNAVGWEIFTLIFIFNFHCIKL